MAAGELFLFCVPKIRQHFPSDILQPRRRLIWRFFLAFLGNVADDSVFKDSSFGFIPSIIIQSLKTLLLCAFDTLKPPEVAQDLINQQLFHYPHGPEFILYLPFEAPVICIALTGDDAGPSKESAIESVKS